MDSSELDAKLIRNLLTVDVRFIPDVVQKDLVELVNDSNAWNAFENILVQNERIMFFWDWCDRKGIVDLPHYTYICE